MKHCYVDILWISDIFESSLEEPPKKKRNLRTSSAHEESSFVQRTNFVAKLGKVKQTLLFALLLNDESPDRPGVESILPCCVGATSTCELL